MSTPKENKIIEDIILNSYVPMCEIDIHNFMCKNKIPKNSVNDILQYLCSESKITYVTYGHYNYYYMLRTDTDVCYGCNETGHTIYDCPKTISKTLILDSNTLNSVAEILCKTLHNGCTCRFNNTLSQLERNLRFVQMRLDQISTKQNILTTYMTISMSKILLYYKELIDLYKTGHDLGIEICPKILELVKKMGQCSRIINCNDFQTIWDSSLNELFLFAPK